MSISSEFKEESFSSAASDAALLASVSTSSGRLAVDCSLVISLLSFLILCSILVALLASALA